MTGGDFFRSLSQAIKLEDLALAKVRRRVYPHVEFNDHQPWRDQFNKDFELILPGIQSPQPKKLGSFFLGDEPTWDDIREGLDGAREVNERFLKLLLDPSERSQTVVLHGPAGGGKSTTLMRVAFLLAQSGKAVYFANARHRLDFRSIGLIARGLEVGQRLYVFADNLATHLDSIVDSLNELKNSTNLTCVFADRSNNYYSRMPALRELQPHELRMPDLVRSDVNSILDRLEKFKFLGVLKTMPRPRQVKEFLDRASKQLLVAMREATSGKGFERILRDEFDGLPPEAQLAYAICSLAVHAGARGVHTRHLTGCLGNSILAQHAIQNQLFGVLVRVSESSPMLKPRHPLIAKWVVREIAPIPLKEEAIRLILVQVSSEIMPNEIRKRSDPYLAYRGLINYDYLRDNIGGDNVKVFNVYDFLKDYYHNDFLFWLQYGRAYAADRRYDVAENYINQSLAIRPNNHQALHFLGVIYLKQATESNPPFAGQDKASEGIQLLNEQILTRGVDDAYPYSAYLTHVARWYSHAGTLIPQRHWEELRRVAETALNRFPNDDSVRNAANEVERKYLRRVVRDQGS